MKNIMDIINELGLKNYIKCKGIDFDNNMATVCFDGKGLAENIKRKSNMLDNVKELYELNNELKRLNDKEKIVYKMMRDVIDDMNQRLHMCK